MWNGAKPWNLSLGKDLYILNGCPLIVLIHYFLYFSQIRKVENSSELMKRELAEVQRKESRSTFNTQVLVQFKDPQERLLPSIPVFQQGFSLKELQSQPNQIRGPLSVASHILFSVLYESTDHKSLPTPPPSAAVASAAAPSVPASTMAVDRPRKFNILTSSFELSFSQYNQFIGRVLFRPDPHFYRPFFNQLAAFCGLARATQLFDADIEKVFVDYNQISAFEFDFTDNCMYN